MIHPGDTYSPYPNGTPSEFFQSLSIPAPLNMKCLYFLGTKLGSGGNARLGGWKAGWGIRQTRGQARSFLPSVSLRLAWVPGAEATSWHVHLLHYFLWRTRAPVATRDGCILGGSCLRPAGQSRSQRGGPAGARSAPGSARLLPLQAENAPRPPPAPPVLTRTCSLGDSPERSPPAESLPFAGGEVGGEAEGWSSGRSGGRRSDGKSQASAQSSAAAGAEREWRRRRRRRPWSRGRGGARHASWRGFLASCFKGAALLSPHPLHTPGSRGREGASHVPGLQERNGENSGRP